MPLETQKRLVGSARGQRSRLCGGRRARFVQYGINAQAGQRLDQRSVYGAIQARGIGAQRVLLTNRQAVRQLAVVQDRAAPAQSPYQRAAGTCRMRRALLMGLEISKRERGLLPFV